MNCSPPGTSDPGISQERILEWVAISFSRVRLPDSHTAHQDWISMRQIIWTDQITIQEIKSVIEKLLTIQSTGPIDFTGKFYQKRIYTNPSQTLPKNWRGGNTPKDILWSQYHPDIKTKQRHHQQGKLQSSISDEYLYKNSQQNISKQNPTIHKKLSYTTTL